ncbi:MAG: glycosyl hydrolase family 28-related protein [Chitinophagaceae bacterium]
MSNTYTGNVINTPVSFSSQPAQAFPDDIKGTLVELDALPSGASVDNIFYFNSPTSGKYLFRIADGSYRAAWAGILPGNSASTNSSRLATLLGNTDIKEIVFDLPEESGIALTGTITINAGQILRFAGGNYITGTVTINGGIIDASYQQMIFDEDVTVNPEGVTGDMVSVKWFGALGDGSNDDQPSIQKAVDTIVANPSVTRNLYFPRGTYNIESQIIIYDWDGTNYQFVTINLIGQDAAHFNQITPEARIKTVGYTDTFAIGIQRARSMKIKGISVEGEFNPPFSDTDWKEYYERPYSTWASSYSVRDSQHSPYAGICIDPFSFETVPTYDEYPGLEDWYRGTGGDYSASGSSGVIIEECRVYGFTVCVMMSPNGYSQQADNIIIRDCALEVCKAAVASGQRQSKDNFVMNAISWDRVHTLLDTITWGDQQGTAPYVNGWNIAGTVIQCFQVTAQHPVTFENMFGEQLYRIGDISTTVGPVQLRGCNFDFNRNTSPILYPHSHLFGANVEFDSCQMRYYEDLFDKRLYFKGTNISFNNCWFDLPPLGQDERLLTGLKGLSFKNCRAGENLYIGYSEYSGYTVSPDRKIVAYGDITITDPASISTYQNLRNAEIFIRAGSYHKSAFSTVSQMATTVNSSARTASVTMTLSYQNLVAVGDYFLINNDDLLGKVSAVNYSTGVISLVDVPLGMVSGNYYIVCCYYELVGGAFVGDLSSGNSTISNVHFQDILGLPTVGSRVKIGPIGAIITAVGSNSITMNLNAGANESGVWSPLFSLSQEEEQWLYTADLEPNGFPSYAYIIPQNAYWNVGIRRLQFTQAGYITPGSGQPQAVWNPDTFTLTGDGPHPVSKGILSFWVKPSTTLTTFDIGTAPSGSDVFSAPSSLAGGQWHGPLTFYYNDAVDELNFSGISSSTQIKIMHSYY